MKFLGFPQRAVIFVYFCGGIKTQGEGSEDIKFIKRVRERERN